MQHPHNLSKEQARAESVLSDAMAHYLGEKYPIGLGSELYRRILSDMWTEGFQPPETYADDCFQEMLTKAVKWMKSHDPGVIRHPRAWFHQIRRRETIRFLTREKQHHNGISLEAEEFKGVLQGKIALSHTCLQDSREVHMAVLEAIAKIKSKKYVKFIYLDLVQQMPRKDIVRMMGIADSYFPKLKCEAMRELKSILESAIDK